MKGGLRHLSNPDGKVTPAYCSTKVTSETSCTRVLPVSYEQFGNNTFTKKNGNMAFSSARGFCFDSYLLRFVKGYADWLSAVTAKNWNLHPKDLQTVYIKEIRYRELLSGSQAYSIKKESPLSHIHTPGNIKKLQ